MIAGLLTLLACQPIRAPHIAARDSADTGPSEDSGLTTDSGRADSGLTDPCLAEPPRADVGTGETEFIPLEDGDTVVVINGSQGGQHILGSLRTWNTDGVVAVRYTLTLLFDGSLISDQTYRLQMFEEGPCQWVYPGMLGYLGFVYGDGQGILKRDVLMRMEVEDVNGLLASDEVTVIPISD